MPALSLPLCERSRKTRSLILQKLASIGQATLAQKIGISESAVSRMKGDGAELDQFAALLTGLGLKAVPIEVKCFEPAKVDWLLQGVKMGIDRLQRAEELAFDDPE